MAGGPLVGCLDRLKADELSYKLLHVLADRRGVTREFRLNGGRDLGQRNRLRQLIPDKSGHLIHGVDGFEIPKPLTDRHKDRFTGDFSGNEIFAPSKADMSRKASHGA